MSGPVDEPVAGWKRTLGTVGGLALGAVLLVAAWAKMVDPVAFVEQIRIEGLDLLAPAQLVALVGIAIEVALGMALVLGLRRLWVLIPCCLLVVFFLFLTGRTYWLFSQGRLEEAASCGCFGNLLARTPAQAFWQDLWMLGVPLVLVFVGLDRTSAGIPRRRLAVVGVVTAASLVFAWMAPELPLDDLATRLRPGVEVSSICTGGGDESERLCLDVLVPALDSGRHWVVITGLESSEFVAGVEELNRHAIAGGEPDLWVLTADPPEVQGRFAFTHAPAFGVREAPATMLRPLYRSLPRSFEVEDGRVMATFPGLPPLEGQPNRL